MIRRVLPIALLLTAAGLSMAQAQPAQPDLNALVAPFVDDQTLLVGHVDMNRVDTDALLQLAINALDAAKIPADDPVRTRVTAMKRLADDYLTQFKALGGRHVFVLLAQQDLVPTPSGPGILIPLEPGASAPAMVTFLRTRLNMQDISDVGNNRVLIARGVTLTRLTHLQPQKRDDLSLLTTASNPEPSPEQVS